MSSVWESRGRCEWPQKVVFRSPVKYGPRMDEPIWMETATVERTDAPAETWVAPLGTPNPPPRGIYPPGGEFGLSWMRVK